MRFEIIRPSQLLNRLHNYEQNRISYQLIDVRDPTAYAREHWPNASSLPYEKAEYLLYKGKFPVDRAAEIILYCSHGGNSIQLARELANQGYRVATINGGYGMMKRFLPENTQKVQKDISKTEGIWENNKYENI